MTGQITAIETSFDGHLFRSRLEARWAVFFNALDIKYSYEPEGFDLGADGYYLPDFWLPDTAEWVEIKGTVPSITECHLCTRLADRHDPVFIQWGNLGEHKAYGWWHLVGTGWQTEQSGYATWKECLTCGLITLRDTPPCCSNPSRMANTTRIHDATMKARATRFEYDDRQPRPFARFKA